MKTKLIPTPKDDIPELPMLTQTPTRNKITRTGFTTLPTFADEGHWQNLEDDAEYYGMSEHDWGQ